MFEKSFDRLSNDRGNRNHLQGGPICARAGDRVCLTDDTPPQRDKLGHRVVYVTLANGRDLSAEVITRGFGLLHRSTCGRGPAYQALETAARIAEQGHWGPAANEVAMFIVAQGATFGGGPPAIAAGGG